MKENYFLSFYVTFLGGEKVLPKLMTWYRNKKDGYKKPNMPDQNQNGNGDVFDNNPNLIDMINV